MDLSEPKAILLDSEKSLISEIDMTLQCGRCLVKGVLSLNPSCDHKVCALCAKPVCSECGAQARHWEPKRKQNMAAFDGSLVVAMRRFKNFLGPDALARPEPLLKRSEPSPSATRRDERKDNDDENEGEVEEKSLNFYEILEEGTLASSPSPEHVAESYNNIEDTRDHIAHSRGRVVPDTYDPRIEDWSNSRGSSSSSGPQRGSGEASLLPMSGTEGEIMRRALAIDADCRELHKSAFEQPVLYGSIDVTANENSNNGLHDGWMSVARSAVKRSTVSEVGLSGSKRGSKSARSS